MTATTDTARPHPGQMTITDSTPGDPFPPYRAVWIPTDAPAFAARCTEASLSLIALRAAAAADQHGEAWIVAGDDTAAHVDATGTVTPATGWAVAAARTIQNRNHRP